MKAPEIVNIKFDECDLYIGRGSKWGNPFPVWECESREDCLKKYEWYLYHQRTDLLADLRELEGKVLGCHCKPRECHGDILIQLFKDRYDTD